MTLSEPGSPDLGTTGDLAAAVDASVSSNDPERSLRRGNLRFVRTVALSVGIQGPTAGVIVGPAVLAGIVGGSGALAEVLALVAMAFVAYAFVIFSRTFNSASSVYAFNGAALGPTYGFVSAWLLLLVYTSFAGAVYASTADIAQSLLASLGVHLWWVWIALAGWALTMVAAYVSIGVSALVIFVCEAVAVVLIAIVGVAVLTHGGHHDHAFSAAPFRLHGVALGVLGLGVVNAFGGFSGFEGAATLGEESSRSTRTIPAAIAVSLLASAAIYIVFTWIVDNAYATPAALAAAPAPLVYLATVDVGTTMGRLVNVGGVISAFGAQLACVNAACRLLFSLGREIGPDVGSEVARDVGRGPGRSRRNLLVHTDRRFGSPVGALVVVGGLSVAALLAFSFEHDATRALTIIVEFGAYLILLGYLLTLVAAVAWTWQHRRRPGPLIVLGVGVLVIGYVLYDTFRPWPPAPFDWIVVAAAGSALLGVVVALVPPVRRRLADSKLLRATRGPGGAGGGATGGGATDGGAVGGA
jgi:amino acid transporter